MLVSVQAESAIGGNLDIASMTLQLNGETVQLQMVRPGLARGLVVAGEPGKYELTAEATDADGGVALIQSFLKVRDANDVAPPVV